MSRRAIRALVQAWLVLAAGSAAAQAQLPTPIANAVPATPISRSSAGLTLALVGADLRLSLQRLAALTGSRLHGIEALPPVLGRVSAQVADVDAQAAWQALLERSQLGFALACRKKACDVWVVAQGASSRVSGAGEQRQRSALVDEGN